jgi:hypothetical protein
MLFLIIGIISLLIGFKIYKPFKKKKKQALYNFYIIGGFCLIAWGIINLLGLLD